MAQSGKTSKLGFKVDRRESYERARLAKKNLKLSKSSPTSVVKHITFDEKSRRSYLLGFHQRKNERRVTAYVDAKKKQHLEHSKLRQEQREEARKAYNMYSKIPILPDFSFRFTNNAEGISGKSTKMSLLSDTTDNVSETRYGDVSVSVEPLKQYSILDNATNFLNDCPPDIQNRLHAIKSKTKGPSQPKAKVHLLKELQKIRKIRKHSRKGHGKSSAKGKKRNRG